MDVFTFFFLSMEEIFNFIIEIYLVLRLFLGERFCVIFDGNSGRWFFVEFLRSFFSWVG